MSLDKECLQNIFLGKTLIFDFDGVVADTHQLHVDFLSRFMSKERIEKALSKSCSEPKPSQWYPFRRQFERVFYYFLYRYSKGYKLPLLYTKVVEAIRANKNPKYLMSMGSKQYVKYILTKQNLDEFFAVYGRFEIRGNKGLGAKMVIETHGLNEDNVVFITDTVEDIMNLRIYENIPVYAVDWGYCRREDFEKVIPKDHILSMEDFEVAMGKK